MEEFDIGYPHSNAQRVLKKGFRTIRNRMVAAGLDREYYDGQRENGYGGFRYDGRWAQIVPRLGGSLRLDLEFGGPRRRLQEGLLPARSQAGPARHLRSRASRTIRIRSSTRWNP